MIGKILSEEETTRLKERMKRMAQELEEYGNGAVVLASIEDSDGAYIMHCRKGNFQLIRGMVYEYFYDWRCGAVSAGTVNDDDGSSDEAEIRE